MSKNEVVIYQNKRGMVRNINGVFTASKLMKASQVRQQCAELRNNPALIIAMELEAKKKIYEMNRKVSSRREVS